MTNTESPIKYLPFIRTLRIVAKLSGWTGYNIHTEGNVSFLSLSRMSGKCRVSLYVYAVEDALYYDRSITLSSGKYVKTNEFQPVNSPVRRSILMSAITGQEFEATSEADRIAVNHESFELAEVEARWPYQIDDEAFPGSFHPMGEVLYAQDL